MALVSGLFLAVTLGAWRIGYARTDWAALFPLPLALVIWAAAWPFFLGPWRIRPSTILIEGSVLARILTGNIRAFILCALSVPAATLLLAWQALSVTAASAAIAFTGAVVAGLLSAAAL